MARSLSRPRPRSSSPAQRKRQRISGGRDSSVPTSPPRTTALVDKLFSQSLPNENLDTPDDPLHSPRTSEPLQSTSPQASPNQSQNIGNPDDPPHLPRKPRSKTSKPAQVPLWPKRKHPDISKSQVTKRRNAYKAKWSEPPQKPAKGTTMPYKLQVLSWFFGNQISERRREEGGEQPVARCYTCKSHGTKMPSAEDAPDGTEVRECAPCGCDFAAACLEYYYVKLGLYNRAEEQTNELHPQRTLVPKAFGQNAYQMLICWEIEHGEWSVEKMIDLHKEKSSALEAISTARIDNNEVLGSSAKKPSALRKKKGKKDVIDGTE